MRYWLDTEFIEDGKTIDLISIGIVAEDGREFYAVNKLFNRVNLFHNQWVVDNVLPHLPVHKVKADLPWSYSNFDEDYSSSFWARHEEIGPAILRFTQNDSNPQFWGYYADYDWVAFCQLFGTMMDLPKGFPMYMRDIKQLCDDLGNPRLPEQGKGEHHALADARWNKIAHEFLIEYAKKGTK